MFTAHVCQRNVGQEPAECDRDQKQRFEILCDCKIEKDKYDPSLVLVFKIAKFFEVSIEDVFLYKSE